MQDSNFDIWTAKHLAQASCSELTLLQRKASIAYISFEVQQNELENEREKVYIHETILHGAFEFMTHNACNKNGEKIHIMLGLLWIELVLCILLPQFDLGLKVKLANNAKLAWFHIA